MTTEDLAGGGWVEEVGRVVQAAGGTWRPKALVVELAGLVHGDRGSDMGKR